MFHNMRQFAGKTAAIAASNISRRMRRGSISIVTFCMFLSVGDVQACTSTALTLSKYSGRRLVKFFRIAAAGIRLS